MSSSRSLDERMVYQISEVLGPKRHDQSSFQPGKLTSIQTRYLDLVEYLLRHGRDTQQAVDEALLVFAQTLALE